MNARALTRVDQAILSGIAKRFDGTTIATRANIILLTSRNTRAYEIADQLRITERTVRRWRKRWHETAKSGFTFEQRLRNRRPARRG